MPDAAAYYWVQTFTVQTGLTITLRGQYPDARYASITVYGSRAETFTSNGVGSTLTDYQIEPDAGNVNPWQHDAAPGGRFTVTIHSDVQPGQPNTLPLAPAGTSSGAKGYLQYRVYLPAAGNASNILPPAITETTPGATVTMAPCKTHNAGSGSPSPATPAATSPTPATSPAVPRQLQFFRPKAAILTFNNTDAVYLLTYLVPPTGDRVVVVTGKAPRSVQTDHPSPWPATTADVRYWSLCVNVGAGLLPVVVNHLPDGSTDSGCRFDEATKLDAAADYTYVIGTESQRTEIEKIPGATFLPFASDQPSALHILMLRNLLVNKQSGYPIEAVPADGTPASAATVLGAYYPRAAVCSLTTLMNSGPSVCLTGK